MKREESSPLGLYTIGIAALFLAGFFLLVIFGAQSYRNTVAQQNGNMRERALLSYLSTTVKGYDSRDAVRVEQTDGGSVLTIADGSTGFALRVYCHEGQLLEDYAAIDAPLAPESAQVIGATDLFEAERGEDGLLRLRTDAGQVLLYLRGEGGAA